MEGVFVDKMFYLIKREKRLLLEREMKKWKYHRYVNDMSDDNDK